MSFHEFAQAETFVQLAHQNRTTVRGNPSALEIDLQRAIEGELKRPILCLTRLPRHLYASPIACKPAFINVFSAFYQIASSLR